MGYWDETDQHMSRYGHGPTCSFCKKEMFPADDHGRFICFCGGRFDVVSGISTNPEADLEEKNKEEKKNK